MSDSNALVRLTTAVRLLSEARDLSEIMRLREMAHVAEEYAKAEKLGDEAVQYAQEIRLRAARKAGEVLRQMAETGQRAVPADGASSREGRLDSPTLSHLGISRDQSSRWQRIAAVPEPEFEEKVAEGWGETAISRGGRVPRGVVTAERGKRSGYTLKQSLSGLQSAAIQIQSLGEALEGGLLGDWSRLRGLDEAQALFQTLDTSLPIVTARLKRALREWKEQVA